MSRENTPLSSPTRSSDRSPLTNRTNYSNANIWLKLRKAPSSPSKRKATGSENERSPKRVKTHASIDSKPDIYDKEVFDDVARAKGAVTMGRKSSTLGILRAGADRLRRSSQHISTRDHLMSFVTSHKTDKHMLPSVTDDEYWTPPYSCSYSPDAKRGGSSLLAVASEQGPIYILNTAQRNAWDPEPQKTRIDAHKNGVFDAVWRQDSKLIATASGDHTSRIIDVETQKSLYILRGHNSTVKRIVWMSGHQDLLASCGRDGGISLWDLRVNPAWQEDNCDVLGPFIRIAYAHDDHGGRVRKDASVSSVTSLISLQSNPHLLTSSSSSNGVLRLWDIRNTDQKSSTNAVARSCFDPTATKSLRPRGIVSLTAGHGATAGLIFGLSADARIYTYHASDLSPTNNGSLAYTHDQSSQTCSYYVRLSVSSCGNWLASGSTRGGKAYLWDVADAGRVHAKPSAPVQLQAQVGEVGAVDWSHDGLATCADDGTIRVWRSDMATARKALEDPEETKWSYSWAKAVN